MQKIFAIFINELKEKIKIWLWEDELNSIRHQQETLIKSYNFRGMLLSEAMEENRRLNALLEKSIKGRIYYDDGK